MHELTTIFAATSLHSEDLWNSSSSKALVERGRIGGETIVGPGVTEWGQN